VVCFTWKVLLMLGSNRSRQFISFQVRRTVQFTDTTSNHYAMKARVLRRPAIRVATLAN